MYLPKALGQIGPEIDRFKRGDAIESRRFKWQLRRAGLQYLATPGVDGALIERSRSFHADLGMVDALDAALWACLQQPSYICTAAAAAVQNRCVCKGLQKLKSPAGKRAMPEIHHGDHYSSAQSGRLARIFKERHAPFTLHSFFEALPWRCACMAFLVRPAHAAHSAAPPALPEALVR